MGLIRSGRTTLTPESGDRELTELLWPVVREMVKTAIENKQNLIAEGCYIPFDWEKSFEAAYIKNHYADIKRYANAIEERLDDSGCTMELLLRDNAEALELCRAHHADYILIDDAYQVDIEL